MYVYMYVYVLIYACMQSYNYLMSGMLKCSCSLCVTCLSVYLTLYVKPPSSII